MSKPLFAQAMGVWAAASASLVLELMLWKGKKLPCHMCQLLYAELGNPVQHLPPGNSNLLAYWPTGLELEAKCCNRTSPSVASALAT
jgi:hypothetical protein